LLSLANIFGYQQHGAFGRRGWEWWLASPRVGKLVKTLQQKSSPYLQLKPHFLGIDHARQNSDLVPDFDSREILDAMHAAHTSHFQFSALEFFLQILGNLGVQVQLDCFSRISPRPFPDKANVSKVLLLHKFWSVSSVK
jgi:hypothetical protein